MVSGIRSGGAGTCYTSWCWVGKEWDVSTIHILGTHSEDVSLDQNSRVGPLEACAIHPLTLFAWVSRILLSAWFAWCLLFVSWGAGMC